MAGMSNPAHDPGTDSIEPDPASRKLSLHPTHPATEPSHVFLGQKPVRREHAIAEEPNTLIAGKDHALVLVDLKTKRLQESLGF